MIDRSDARERWSVQGLGGGAAGRCGPIPGAPSRHRPSRRAARGREAGGVPVSARRRRCRRSWPVPVAAVLVAAAAVAWGAGPARAQEPALPELDEVIEHVDALYRSESSHAVMTMTVVRERGTRELTLESWTKGEERALVVIREPAREAGTATLRTEEGLWSYGARADRLIRIPTGLLSESWMGSHLTNDDLMRETSYDDDYESELSWTTRDGERYLRVLLTPRPDAPVVYTRLVFLLTADEWVPVVWEFYDEDRLVRTMRYEDVRTISGRRLPTRFVVEPADSPDERTVIRYDELRLDVPVDDDVFTRRGLRRAVS